MAMSFGTLTPSGRAKAAARRLLATANAARDRREWSRAAMIYDQYLAMPLCARQAPIWVQLGNMRKESGHLQMAQAAYATALHLDPTKADTHLQMGHLAKRIGRLGDAEASYANAARLDPLRGDARAELATLKDRSRDEQQAPHHAVPDHGPYSLTQAGFQVGSDPAVMGHVDDIKGDAIRGWAAPQGTTPGNMPAGHEDGGAGALTVTVLHDGRPIGHVKADQYRPDIARHHGCSPHCGFQFKVPARFRDGTPAVFEFQAEPDGAPLPGSPFHYQAPGAAVQARLATLSNTIEEMSVQLWQMRRDLNVILAEDATGLDAYDGWARRYQTALRFRRRHAAPLPRTPLVSIVCPVYRPRLADFRAAVRSVLAQTYANWELILVDDASGDDALTREIQGFCADPRVRALPQRQNAGISAATNIAIAAARGEYIALFDHDDVLLDVAVEIMVDAALRTGTAMIYSDEDRVGDDGRFSEPNLKPDWNYRLLLGQNYVCHFLVVEAGVLRAAGPLDKAYDGAQDHDLVLRLSEAVPASRIHHVPEILYHWRKTPGSTASEIGNKTYAVDAGATAVRDHLKRRGHEAAVWPMLGATTYSIDWRMTAEPSVCIVIPYREQIEMTRRCVEAIRTVTHYRNYEIILVDNWSTSIEAAAFRIEAGQWRGTKVLLVEEAFNYFRLNNRACAETTAEYLVFMNNDVFVEGADWLRRMVDEAMVNDTVAAVGPKLVYPDRTVQHGGVILGAGGIADHAYRGRAETDPFFMSRGICAQELSAVTAALMLCRHSAFDAVQGFDEDTFSVAYNDVDLCLKLRRAGWSILYVPGVVAEHRESMSRGDDMERGNFGRFIMEERAMQQRWGAELARDPFNNPNFSSTGRIFEELATAPLAFYPKG